MCVQFHPASHSAASVARRRRVMAAAIKRVCTGAGLQRGKSAGDLAARAAARGDQAFCLFRECPVDCRINCRACARAIACFHVANFCRCCTLSRHHAADVSVQLETLFMFCFLCRSLCALTRLPLLPFTCATSSLFPFLHPHHHPLHCRLNRHYKHGLGVLTSRPRMAVGVAMKSRGPIGPSPLWRRYKCCFRVCLL